MRRLLKALMGTDEQKTIEDLEKANKGLYSTLSKERERRKAAVQRAEEAERAVVQLGRKLERLMLSGPTGQAIDQIADSIAEHEPAPLHLSSRLAAAGDTVQELGEGIA